MSNFKIEFNAAAGRSEMTVEADYYKLEDNWFTFKDAAHKSLMDVCATDVAYIQRVDVEADIDPTSNVIRPFVQQIMQRLGGVNLTAAEAERLGSFIAGRARS